jgi:soluble lytic murein transglycosylase-like protein
MGATGCQQYKHLFEQYPWPQELAMTICEMESDGIATASNWKDSHAGCNGSFGLMQIGCLHGVHREDLYDPATNIKVAYQLWKERGFAPWSTYHKLLAMN